MISVRPVAFDPDASGVALLLIDSHARHRHASGEYAARRASCERAATDLGVVALRDVQHRGSTVLDAVTDPVDARRARHVLSENLRVLDFVAALSDCDFKQAGLILTTSHVSMREDFEITTANIDLIADTSAEAGALGARMTGGGFGGCVIALVPAGRIAAVSDAVRQTVSRAGFPTPTITHTRAGLGGMRL